MPKAPVNGIDLYYESHGSDSAPTIVFAHGRGGNHMSWWQQVAAFSGGVPLHHLRSPGLGSLYCRLRLALELWYTARVVFPTCDNVVMRIPCGASTQKSASQCRSRGSRSVAPRSLPGRGGPPLFWLPKRRPMP